MKYTLSLKEILIAKSEGFPEGSGYFFTIHPDLRHNTDILNYNFSTVLSGRAILEDLILHIAPAAGAIFYSKFPALRENTPSSTGSIFSSKLPVELDLFGKILPS